ncbi:S8 family serine peptidase [Cellulomonas sp. P5_E12]
MAEKKSTEKKSTEKKQVINIAHTQWRGDEIAYRVGRVIAKVKVERGKPDPERVRRIAEELAGEIPDARVLRVSAGTGTIVLTVPDSTDVVAAADQLSRRGDVIFAGPDRVTSVTVTPSDSRYSEQWGFPKIKADLAWDHQTGAAGVLVADIDTGISFASGALTHPDLDDAGRYTLGTDFVSDDATPQDAHGHGTHTAGTAAAESNNGVGVAGMNWVSPVYVCRVFDASGNGSEADFEAAVEEIVDYAVAHSLRAVINLSAGWFTDNQVLRDACAYAHDHGMVLCVATGNEGGALRTPAIHSADFAGVIAVGATDSGDAVAGFSNVGPAVSVVAPGVGILSTFPTYDVTGDTVHDYVSWDGTSMATPHVTGLASLVWSQVPQLTNEQVRDVVCNTAVKLGAGDFDNSWGHGRVDALDAVLKAGWALTPVQLNLTFLDVPEGETQLRAIRIDVQSFHQTAFEMSGLPAAPFSMHNYSGPVTLGKSTDYDTPREVYLWVRYTGTTAGDTASGTAEVTCTTTGAVYPVTITANTIARPTAAMALVLDQSGSMLDPSGVGTMTREQVLRFSAGIFVDYVREHNGVGMVTFDQDSHDLLTPVAGPFGAPDDPFDVARTSARTALGGYAANPAGSTAIGDGIGAGHDLIAATTGYEKNAIIVFTDGKETASRYIADVASLIDNQVFAVGLGTASELNPAALRAICHDHDGYVLLTDQLDADDNFKLAKYFLQIQAGVNNEDVVVDPDGYVAPGAVVRIPFILSEADISVDPIVLMPMQDLLQVAIETPQGDLIDAGNVGSFPTVKKVDRPNISYYRMTLPVQDGVSVNAQEGTWNLVLTVDKKIYKRYLTILGDGHQEEFHEAVAHGVKFTAMVHSFSNLRMAATLTQDGNEPGATLYLRSRLTEYGEPLPTTASVRAELTAPDGSTSTVTLTPTGGAVYEATVPAHLPGIYRFVVGAAGSTSRRMPFTRQQVVTGAVWRGGNDPDPTTDDPGRPGTGTDDVCHLLRCAARAMSPELRKQLEESGFSVDTFLKCTCGARPKVERG